MQGVRYIEPSKSGLQEIKGHLELYEVYRSYVRHEDTLMNYRLTWLLTFNGILFGVFGIMLQRKIDNSSHFVAKLTGIGVPKSLFFIKMMGLEVGFGAVDLYLIGIALMGWAIAFTARRSILAARDAVDTIDSLLLRLYGRKSVRVSEKTCRKAIEIGPGIQLPSVSGGGRPDLVLQGGRAALAIPRVLMVAWVGAAILTVLAS